MPDGQELDVIVTARTRAGDGTWWYACEAILPDRYEDAEGGTQATAAPTPITVSAEDITPLPGEDYGAVPTDGAVSGRQWLLARVRVPAMDGPPWRLHRRDCWQAGGETRRITTEEAYGRLAEERAEVCEVCRPDRALLSGG